MIGRLGRRLAGLLAAGSILFAGTGLIKAAAIVVPNASFELPATGYASPNIESWQKSPKPDWYVEGGGFYWSQLTGAFRNQPPNDPTHIDNCDGNQAMWLFAVPEVAIFQDFDSVDWNDPAPSHAFDATFEVGKSYRLTVGVIGGGGGMLEGVTLEISFYYRDSASNRVTVARTSITNTPALFPNTTHLVNFTVDLPFVKANDAWAGHNIGVQFLSTVDTNLQSGGYWDLDNVRLSAIDQPSLGSPVQTNGQFQFTVQSEPGVRFEILASENLAGPITNWTNLGIVTNLTGATSFTDPTANGRRRFYQARQLP